MKIGVYLLTAMFLASCKSAQEKEGFDIQKFEGIINSSVVVKIDQNNIEFTDQQLEGFLDSIGSLSPDPFVAQASFYVDSIFEGKQGLDILIGDELYVKLKLACIQKRLDIKTAIAIFKDIKIDSTYRDSIPLTYISFDENEYDFSEFAVCPVSTFDEAFYFFSANRMIAKLHIGIREGSGLRHFRDVDNKTVVYYEEDFQRGSGIWWTQFFFYKYYKNRLIPILNEVQNSNLRYPWGRRNLWFQSTIIKTCPLTIKMVYDQSFSDSGEDPYIIADSTIVYYTWDEQLLKMQGNYDNSRISKTQILTYYHNGNEILFINVYYQKLKELLRSHEVQMQVLEYLNDVMNFYQKSQR